MKSQIYEKITIRLALPKDKYDITEIQYNAVKVIAAKDYNQRQLNAFLKSKSTPRKSPETIFVAEIDSQTVGFASLLYPPNTIGAVFVSPHFARRNIGTLLLERLEQEAIEQQVPILWVYSSLTGYHFYKANGYQAVYQTALPLRANFLPCIRMKKRLLPVSKEEIFQEISQLLFFLTLVLLIIFFLKWN